MCIRDRISGILRLIRDDILRKQGILESEEKRFERTLSAWFLNIWEGDPFYEGPGKRLDLRRHDDVASFDALARAD
eukprot:12117940-Prorocentrum_lima.AAC.1